MTRLNLTPDIPLNAWVKLWEKCYSKDFDEAEYAEFMKQAKEAQDEVAVRVVLGRAFKWKDSMKSRWENEISQVSYVDWLRWKNGVELPTLFANGVVYDAFVAHVANDHRPIIDQHVWRAYCRISGRPNPCEFPTYKKTATLLYIEYENWFNEVVSQGAVRREFDRALMAFGQFCKSQFKAFADHCLQEHLSRYELSSKVRHD